MGCLLCAWGNDLPPGEYCRNCGQESPLSYGAGPKPLFDKGPHWQEESDDPLVWTHEEAEEMREAFRSVFGEELPRTETLFAVAAVGYRIARRRLTTRGR